jgi:hypothetical protein
MNTSRAIFHLMRADFLERIRSYGFLALLLFTVFLTYLFIPDINAIQIVGLYLGGYRATYNSAWIGTMTTLLMGEFFLIFSFYLLKGSVERDRRTGVGQILATTPMTKALYTLGKWLSNVAVATAMTLAIFAATVLLQLIRADDLHLDLWALASPFLIVLFPALTVIAAAAVLFDCLPVLRGGLGNVLFFIAYLILTLFLDLQGNAILYPSIYAACAAQFTGCNPNRQIDAGLPPLADYPAFHYDGVTWLPSVILSRLAVILVGALIALLAAWLFHRFDPAKADKTIFGNFSLKRTPAPQAVSAAEAVSTPRQPTHLTAALSPVPRTSSFSSLVHLFVAELRLTFKGTRWLWILFALGIFLALTFAPLDAAQTYLLPFAFVLPLTFWSNLGIRETKHRADLIIFSAPHSLTHHLPITWLTGVSIALALTFPLLLRLALTGEWSAAGSLLVGLLFVPSLALALGCWSNGSKLFEGGYLFFWYIASMFGIPVLDFMGRIPAAREQRIPLLYLLATLLLLSAAYFGRRQTIK